MLEHIYGQGDYAPERAVTDRRGEVRYQLEAGVPTLDPKFDAGLLLSRHHGKGKEARHIIFSAEEMPNATEAEYQHALSGVVDAAVDFATTQAPGHDFIIVPHKDRHHPHCHAVLCASDSDRCIDWGAKDLKNFQGLSFLRPETQQHYQLISGRGRGKRPAGVGRISYANAVNHVFHATVEHETANKLDYEHILQAIADGIITVSRKTKAGKPLSVLIDGKAVRLSTLRKASGNAGSDDSAADATGSLGTGSFPGTAHPAKITQTAQPTVAAVAPAGATQRRTRPRPQPRAARSVRD